MMNIKQVGVLLVATVCVSLVYLYPPYWIEGTLIGGTVYVYYQNPPPATDGPSFNWWLVRWELGFILFSTVTGLIAFGSRAKPRQKALFIKGFTLEALIFVCSAPSFKTILAPEFTWYSLTFLSVILLVVVLVFRMYNKRMVETTARVITIDRPAVTSAGENGENLP
jgi:hypothetical protein